MKPRSRPESVESALKPLGSDYQVRILGAARTPLRDFYHALMQLSWPATMGAVALGYAGVNGLFACVYYWAGGIANARPGFFRDDFYFSVQTMGTIGYGSMYPKTDLANDLVFVQSTLGLVLTALATGLVFAKFSRPTARLLFSSRAAIAPMNGVPTLSFRIGNLRKNRIMQAQIRVALVRSERTTEGKDFYRMIDLKLSRDHALSLARAWTVLHPIDEKSPFFGETPESLAAMEAELAVTVIGIDDTWMQTVQASHRYAASEIAWGARLADTLSEAGTVITLDLTKFHELEPSEPTDTFAYPKKR